MTPATGCFVAVVGPSGAGKDTVLGYARDALGGNDRIRFVRRAITRQAGAGEDHEPVAADAFDEAERRGAYALSWGAHGLRYGIPASVDARIADGDVVVANISRASVADARRRFARCLVVHITAPAEVRLARILERGREDDQAARARVARAVQPVGSDLEIVNDRAVADSGGELVRFLDGQLALA